MRVIHEPKYDFSDCLILPKRSSIKSRKDVDLTRNYTFKHSKREYTGFPLIAANMDHTGTFEMAHAMSAFGASVALHKHYNAEELIRFFKNPLSVPTFYSMGIGSNDYCKFKRVYEYINGGIDYVCIDVANGYTEAFVSFISKMRDEYPSVTIMAGNIVTAEMAEQLMISGADIIKCGIGPGSVCTTRKITGVGYPQLSAVMETAEAVHGLGGHLCSDGGHVVPGDVSKAYAAGADFVMLGGMLAGHQECNGYVVFSGSNDYIPTTASSEADVLGVFYDLINHQFYVKSNDIWVPVEQYNGINGTPSHMSFYGMSSKPAMDKHSNGVAEYRASEGKEVLLPYNGPVASTVRTIMGGVRSTCTYTGSKQLKDLSKRTTFITVHQTHNTVFGDE